MGGPGAVLFPGETQAVTLAIAANHSGWDRMGGQCPYSRVSALLGRYPLEANSARSVAMASNEALAHFLRSE